MAHDEGKHSLEAKFAAAVKVMRSLPEEGAFQPSDDMMLKFYSYYKQATSGPCHIPRPTGFWDSYGKAKWDAWSSLGNMEKEEAMKNYVEDIQLILEAMPVSDEVSELVQKLGDFYTEVDVGEEDAEDSHVSRRPFTRPFANADEVEPFRKPAMEGYGDLWDDIQNLEGKDRVCGLSVSSSEEMEGSREDSEIERKEESSDWRRSEEEENGDEEDYTEDEDKDDGQKERRRGSRLPMAEDARWRPCTRGSSSSAEPSVSSYTNGTHSSLNSEAEEEELTCSPEPSIQCNPYMHFNGHLSDHSDSVPEKNHRSTDSDNEEFCDSMEHLAMEECKVQSPEAASVKQRELWFESSATLNGGEDQVLLEISTSQHSSSSRGARGSPAPAPSPSQLCVGAEARCCCASQKTQPVSGALGGNVSEQIATTLLRLQRDMADVLHRLNTLETLTASQISRSSSPRQEESQPVARKFLRPSWWPFDYSPLTMMLTALWPLIAHWFVQLCLQRRRRKIP